MKSWKFSPRATIVIFVGICLLMIASTALIALGYLSAPAQQEPFKQIVVGTVLRAEENAHAVRVVDMTWPEEASQEDKAMVQLYAQIPSTAKLTDGWGTEITVADLREGATVQVEIGMTKFRDEEKTVASASVYTLVLDPQ